jgi:hypothetical protein
MQNEHKEETKETAVTAAASDGKEVKILTWGVSIVGDGSIISGKK